MIYLNNASTTPFSESTKELLSVASKGNFWENISDSDEVSNFTKAKVDEARNMILKSVSADKKSYLVYFTSCGSESNTMAIRGVVDGFHRKHPEDKIVIFTTPIEHDSILNCCKYLEKNDDSVNVEYLSVNSEGQVYKGEFERRIREYSNIGFCIIVSIMTVNNEIGTIQDIEGLCEIAHKYGAIFHTDAVQAIGNLDVSSEKTKADMISVSGHKFGAPSGIGCLISRIGLIMSPVIFGGKQEYCMRGGTQNTIGIMAMVCSMEKSVQNIREKNRNEYCLKQKLLYNLHNANVDFVCNSSSLFSVPNIVSLSFAGINGEALKIWLESKGIIVSTGSACSESGSTSHVLKAIGIPEKYINGTIRVSFSIENTEDDVVQLSKSIIEYIKATKY